MGIRLLASSACFVAAIVLAGCGGGTKEAAPDLSPEAAAGKEFAASSCGGCHSTSGATSAGPTWKGLAGSQVHLADGTTVTADDAYLTTAILDPGAQVVKGFNNTMASSFPPGSITEEQAAQLVAYIKTLK